MRIQYSNGYRLVCHWSPLCVCCTPSCLAHMSVSSLTSVSIVTSRYWFQRSFHLISPSVCFSGTGFSSFSLPLSKSLFQLLSLPSGFCSSVAGACFSACCAFPSSPILCSVRIALPPLAVLLFSGVSERTQLFPLVQILRNSSMQHVWCCQHLEQMFVTKPVKQ